MKIAVHSQVLNGILLPFVLVFMLLLVNKKMLLGRFTNSRRYNVVAWTLTGLIIALTAFMLVKQ